MTTGVKKRVCLIVCLGVVLALGSGASAAQADFGISNVDLTFTGTEDVPALQAGSHPFSATATVELNTKPAPGGLILPDGDVKDLVINLPAGLAGNPTPVPTCSSADFARIDAEHAFSACPVSSAVGVAEPAVAFGPVPSIAAIFKINLENASSPIPVFNLEPPPGVVSKLGFVVLSDVPVTVESTLNPNPPYNLITRATNVPNVAQFYGARVSLWGVPADPAHDSQRGACAITGKICSVSLPEIPFLTLPTSCQRPLRTSTEADSWQQPGLWTPPFVTETDDGGEPPQSIPLSGCDALAFRPTFQSQPTDESAESPSGLDFNLDFENEGLVTPDGRSESTIEQAVVKFPPGITANPGLAQGLAGCSEADLAREALNSAPGDGCPQASKIGTVEVESPLLEDRVVGGEVFVASQNANPFGSLLATYVVVREPKLGILLKLAGKIEPDSQTGQLVATFGEAPYELPQLPFSHLRLHLRGGSRGPLVTPPTCGSFETTATLTPSSGGNPVQATSSFEVTSGIGGTPCPNPGGPFSPSFEAGSSNVQAASYSPFVLHIARADGQPNLTRFDAVLPKGVAGKIAGVGKCSDAAIAGAGQKSGREEIARPSCPAGSELGHLVAAAGVGSQLTQVEGKLYLGGPFGGDPLSVVAITPAVAGPFDLGTVVTREALTLDPLTAQVKVDGAASDPIPQMLKGIPVRLRDLKIYTDKPNFTTTPSGCDVRAVTATVFGVPLNLGVPSAAAAGSSATLSQRYQVANCASLGFAPKLKLALVGATRRASHPALKSRISYPYKSWTGHSNIGRAVVTLPKTEFIDNAHISTPCTRVQFAVNACPPGSILGRAKAVSPLLDEALEGPVYFRSNGGERELPDIVADLHGLFRVQLVGFVDSKNGGVRTTFASPPDVPVSEFTLNLKGGKHGLLINNTNLCSHVRRAKLRLVGQNGKARTSSPVVRTSCKKKRR